jgi:hypothetical protein
MSPFQSFEEKDIGLAKFDASIDTSPEAVVSNVVLRMQSGIHDDNNDKRSDS